MSKYHDDASYATDPGQITLSPRRLRGFHPQLFGFWAWVASFWSSRKTVYGRHAVAALAEHLALGDARAAMVMSVSPLLVAAYSDDLDCVAMLAFPDALTSEYSLSVGQRLLTVNTYASRIEAPPATDLVPGPGDTRNWGNFHPMIADFLAEDVARLAVCKRGIATAEWERTWELGREWLRRGDRRPRDGAPLFSMHATGT